MSIAPTHDLLFDNCVTFSDRGGECISWCRSRTGAMQSFGFNGVIELLKKARSLGSSVRPVLILRGCTRSRLGRRRGPVVASSPSACGDLRANVAMSPFRARHWKPINERRSCGGCGHKPLVATNSAKTVTSAADGAHLQDASKIMCDKPLANRPFISSRF